MTDPFSVAGSAVGVVSLGLTVCKELISYVGHVKDRDVEVELISGRMEKLAEYLEQLQAIINRVDSQTTTFGSNVTAMATSGIEACAAALRKIETKLQSTTDPHNDTTFRGRARAWKTRLAYPFRRDDVLFLKDLVESVQQNLTTALQALQLNLQRLAIESSSEQLNRLSDLTISSNRMIHDISTTSSQVLAVQNTLDPFASEVRTMLTTLVAHVNRMDQRTSDTSSESYEPLIVQEDIYQFRQVQNRVDRLGTSRTAHRWQRSRVCDCNPVTDTKTTMWLFNITRSRTQQHKPGCPYSKFQQIHTRLQIRVAICGFRLRRKAEISFDICSGGGVFSFMPAWRIQRVVSRDSPGFALIEQLQDDYGGITRDYDQRMLQLFERREATPYDIDKSGRTLLHHLIDGMYWNQTPNTPFNYLQMTRFLLGTMGPVAHQYDSFKRSCLDTDVPVDMIIPHECSETYLEIIRSGIQPTWSNLWYSPARLWSSILPFIKNSETLHDFIENHPMMFSMLSKSESSLEEFICKDPNLVNQNIGEMSPLELATKCEWPVGCEVLLKAGAVITRGGHLLEITAYNMCKDIVQFWLNKRRLISQDDVEHIGSPESVLALRFDTMGNDLQQLFIDHIVALRQGLEKIAQSALPDLVPETSNRILDAKAGRLYDNLVRAGVDVHPSLRPSWPSLYQPPYEWSMPGKLYSAGFLDLELKDVGPGLMSPMQWHALLRHFGMCEWLLSKGVSLDERWHASQVTARQILGFVVGYALQYFEESRSLEPFLKFIVSNCSDECSCACTTATSGCTFMSSSFKGMTEPGTTYWASRSRWSSRQQLFLFTSWVAPAVRTDRELASVVFRSLTFWKLGLQHTCCDIGKLTQEAWKVVRDNYQGYEELVQLSPTRYSPDELVQVQKEDSFLIGRLEVLVARCVEQFENSDEDIVNFILGYWSEQMRYELEELWKMDDEEHGEGRMKMGVALDPDETIDGLTGDIDLDERRFSNWNGKYLTLREAIPSVWGLDKISEDDSEDEIGEDDSEVEGVASNDDSMSSENSNSLDD